MFHCLIFNTLWFSVSTVFSLCTVMSGMLLVIIDHHTKAVYYTKPYSPKDVNRILEGKDQNYSSYQQIAIDLPVSFTHLSCSIIHDIFAQSILKNPRVYLYSPARNTSFSYEGATSTTQLPDKANEWNTLKDTSQLVAKRTQSIQSFFAPVESPKDDISSTHHVLHMSVIAQSLWKDMAAKTPQLTQSLDESAISLLTDVANTRTPQQSSATRAVVDSNSTIRVSQCKGTVQKRFSLTIDEWFTTFQLVPHIPAMAQVTPKSERQALVRMLETWRQEKPALSHQFDSFIAEQARNKKQGIYIAISLADHIHMMLYFPYTTKGITVNFQTVHIDAFEWTSPVILGEITDALIIFDEILQKHIPFIVPNKSRVSSLLSIYGSFVIEEFTSNSAPALFTILMNKTSSIGMFYGQNVFVGTLFGMPITPARLEYIQRVHGWSEDVFMKQATPFVSGRVAKEVFDQEKTHKHKRPYAVQGTLQWKPNYHKKELTVHVKGVQNPYALLGMTRFIESMIRYAIETEKTILREQTGKSTKSASAESSNFSDFDSDDSIMKELAALKKSKEDDDIIALKKELFAILRQRRKGLPQEKVWKNDVMRNKIKNMFDLMGKSHEFEDKSVQYTRTCQNFRQPILLDNESDWKQVNRVEEIRKELFDKSSRAFHYALHSTKEAPKEPYDTSVEDDKKIRIMLGSYVQICPLSWCLYDNLPVSFHDYESTTDVFGQTKPANTCPYCRGTPLPFKNKKLNHGKQMAGKVGDTLIVRSRDENMVFPGFNVPKVTFDICLPCCFKKPSADKKPMCRTYFQVDTKPAKDPKVRAQALAHASNIQPPILEKEATDASSKGNIEVIDPSHRFYSHVSSSKALSNILTETKIKPGQFAWLPKSVHAFLHSHELDKTFVLRKGPTSELQPNVASYVRLHAPISMNGFHNLRLLLPTATRNTIRHKNDMISFIDEKLKLHSILFCPFMIKHLSVPFGIDIVEDRYAYLIKNYGEEISTNFNVKPPTYREYKEKYSMRNSIQLIDYAARVKESLMTRLQENDIPMSYIAEWCSVGFPWINKKGVNVMILSAPLSSGSLQLRQFFPLRDTHNLACFVHDEETSTYHPIVWISSNGKGISYPGIQEHVVHIDYKAGRDMTVIRPVPTYLNGYFTYESFTTMHASSIKSYAFAPNGDMYGYSEPDTKKKWNPYFVMEYSNTVPIRILPVEDMRLTMKRVLRMDQKVRDKRTNIIDIPNDAPKKEKQVPTFTPFILSFIRAIGKDKAPQKEQTVNAVRLYNDIIIGLQHEIPLSQVPPTKQDPRSFGIEEQYVYRGQLVEQPSLGMMSSLHQHTFYTHAYHALFEEVKNVVHTYFRNNMKTVLYPIREVLYSTMFNYYEKYDKLYPKISAIMKSLFVSVSKMSTSITKHLNCPNQTSPSSCDSACAWSKTSKRCRIPLPRMISDRYQNLLDLFILRMTHMLISDRETRLQMIEETSFAYAQSKYAIIEYTFQRRDLQELHADNALFPGAEGSSVKDIVIRIRNVSPEQDVRAEKVETEESNKKHTEHNAQPKKLETIDDILYFARRETGKNSIDVTNRLGYRDIFFAQLGQVLTDNGIDGDVWKSVIDDMKSDPKQAKQLLDQNAFKAKQFALFVQKYIPCTFAMFTCQEKPKSIVNVSTIKSSKSPLFTIAIAVDPKGHVFLLYDSKRNTYTNIM